MHSRLLLLIAILIFSPLAYAQSEQPARYQLYGGYTMLSNSFNGVPGNRQPLNGWDASMAFAPWHNLRFKIDTYRYSGTNIGAPQNALFIMGGGQYTWRVRRESIFIEGLAGDGGINRNWGPNATSGETASFATLIGGGLDTPLSRRFAFRVSGGFQYSYFALQGTNGQYPVPYLIPGLPTYFGRLSTGIVWGF